MNALVASVIRTYTPIIVGALVAWITLIHVPIDPSLTVLLTAVVGAALSGAYYTLVRVLEQQWPWVGAFLGLTASPDAYSKGNVPATSDNTPAIAQKVLTAADASATESVALTDAAPASTFPKAAVDAVSKEPDPVVSTFTAPASAESAPVA